MVVKRESYSLTPEEITKFKHLYKDPGVAFEFWRVVAAKRGLDHKTIIGTDYDFTALPLDHGKHWCYPSDLSCGKPPPKQKN